MTFAPGSPGIPPTWCSSAKDMVTTALGASRLWATVGHGILNEVYWPSTGEPQLRDLGFIVAGPSGWHEVKRVYRYRLSLPSPDIPLPAVVHEGDGYTLALEFLPDPARDALLIRYRLDGDGLRLYPLMAPHLAPYDQGTTARVLPDALTAGGGRGAICLVASEGFDRGSAGHVGVSDGWQDFSTNGRMTWEWSEAGPGNVALMGELHRNTGVLSLGLAASAPGASSVARAALSAGYDEARAEFLMGWRQWSRRLRLPRGPKVLRDAARLSAAVIKVHEDRVHAGAIVASLSVPWGNHRNSLGGYHLVWTRDALEAGQALLAAGQTDDARRLLAYLVSTQQPEGHWTQNMFSDGTPFWTGIQLDEVGAPILLAQQLREAGALEGMTGIAAMVRRAAQYLAHHGPMSQQDRWEENAGASPFTLAIEVAALVAAAEWLDEQDCRYALSLADFWNRRIEEWTYVTGTPLDQELDTAGHYVRIGPTSGGGLCGRLMLRNREDGGDVPAQYVLGLDFLYLVRLGLRRADDPRITDTVKLADILLATDTPCGLAYHRYSGDGYGENADGTAYDGAGVGRGWPLLSGERGHQALLSGHDPTPYLEAMACMRGPGGLMPEQVWDDDPVPGQFLFPGKPTGSAMPLVWTHAEFLQLYVARVRGAPNDMLTCVQRRYHAERPVDTAWHWRTGESVTHVPESSALLIEAAGPFVLHFGFDGWTGATDRPSEPLGLGMHGVRLEPGELAGHHTIEFTRRFGDAWEGKDYTLALG